MEEDTYVVALRGLTVPKIVKGIDQVLRFCLREVALLQIYVVELVGGVGQAVDGM